MGDDEGGGEEGFGIWVVFFGGEQTESSSSELKSTARRPLEGKVPNGFRGLPLARTLAIRGGRVAGVLFVLARRDVGASAGEAARGGYRLAGTQHVAAGCR